MVQDEFAKSLAEYVNQEINEDQARALAREMLPLSAEERDLKIAHMRRIYTSEADAGLVDLVKNKLEILEFKQDRPVNWLRQYTSSLKKTL